MIINEKKIGEASNPGAKLGECSEKGSAWQLSGLFQRKNIWILNNMWDRKRNEKMILKQHNKIVNSMRKWHKM